MKVSVTSSAQFLTVILLVCSAFAAAAQKEAALPDCRAAKQRGPSSAGPRACAGFIDAPNLFGGTPFSACYDACAAREGGTWRQHHNTCQAACQAPWKAWRAQMDEWEASPSARLAYLCSKDESVRQNAACPGAGSEAKEASKAPVLSLTGESEETRRARAQALRNRPNPEGMEAERVRQQQIAKVNAEQQVKVMERELQERTTCMKPEMRNMCGCLRFQPRPPGGHKTCSK